MVPVHSPTLAAPSRTRALQSFLLFGFCWSAAVWSSADWERAVDAYQRGDLAVAIEVLQGVVESHPNYAPAHSFLGAALYRAGRAEESLGPFERGIALDPSDEPSRLLWVRALVDLERYDEAVAGVQPIVGEDFRSDQRIQWVDLLGFLTGRVTTPESLLPSLSSSVDRFPEDAGLWTALGRLQERLGQRSDSLLSLERAVDIEPSLERRRRYLEAALRFDEAETDDGGRFCRAAVDAGQGWGEVEPETALLIAECHLGSGGCEEASPWLERITSGPSMARALLYRGQCAAVAQDSSSAIQFLEDARERSTGDVATSHRILLALGEAYHADHRYRSAAAVFATAGETDRASAMELAQQDAVHNAALDLKIAQCEERRDRYDALLAEHRDLEGTADWVALLRTYEDKLSDCRAYL